MLGVKLGGNFMFFVQQVFLAAGIIGQMEKFRNHPPLQVLDLTNHGIHRGCARRGRNDDFV